MWIDKSLSEELQSSHANLIAKTYGRNKIETLI